jgi:predicted TIM-barrel fold metal-dependent hydrolase
VIREFPMVNFIIGHFGIQTGGNYSFEAFWMAMDTPNVVCESGWTFQSRIVEFARELPRHKIVFGTDSPPNEPGMWLRELEVLCGPPPQGMNLDEDGLEDYMGNNIARLCGIRTTPPPRNMDEAKARLKDSYAGVPK